MCKGVLSADGSSTTMLGPVEKYIGLELPTYV